VRLIYQAENLRALPRAHGTLSAVIDEILSQTVGPYRNKLEARHDEAVGSCYDSRSIAVAKQMEHDISFAPKGESRSRYGGWRQLRDSLSPPLAR